MTRRPFLQPRCCWMPCESPEKATATVESAPPHLLPDSDTRHTNETASSHDSAGNRLAHVGELVEIIFLHLDFDDLIRAQSVCRFWRQTVLGTRSLRPLLYKQAVTPQSDNEFFEHIEVPSDAMTGVSFDVLQNIWQWNVMLQNFVEDDNMEKAWERYNEARRELRANAQAMHSHPYPVPMPQFLSERKCKGCQSWHNTIRSERLHPLIRRYGKERLCFKGWGTSLVISIDLDHWGLSHQSPGLRHVRPQLARMRTLHTLLQRAQKEAQAQSLANDRITRPCCTKLIVTDTRTYQVKNDEAGITVETALRLMTRVCHSFLLFLNNFVQDVVHAQAGGDARTTMLIEDEMEDTLRLFEDLL